MRKPFLYLLIIFSFWVWSLDLVDILFYYAKYHYSTVIGHLIALIPFGILMILFTKLFSKYYQPSLTSVIPIKARIKEYACLFLFFLPILYLNYKRIMFPDVNYDIGAYHLYLQELHRLDNLKNFNMVGGPGGGTYFFTLSYKIFGFFRNLLGFRMATIFNSFLLFVCLVSIYDFIKQVVKQHLDKMKIITVLMAVSSLFVIWADNTLIVLNTYMVDLIGIPILLELVAIVVFKKISKQDGFTTTLFFFLLVSLLVTYKLTYLPYAFVLSVCFLVRNYSFMAERKQTILLGFITLLFPSIYLLYNYIETQNPIFPFYNKLFESPLFEIRNFKDERWGPRNFMETFYYNIVCATDGKRSNEWKFFSVRLLTEYFIILAALIYLLLNKFKTKDNFIKLILGISGIAILLNYMLLFTTGYYRYGVIIEMLFGLCIILWLFYFFQHKKYILFTSLLIISLIQCVNTFNRNFKRGTNLSWYDYHDMWHTDNAVKVKNEIPNLFNDRHTNVDSIISRLNIDAFLSSDCDGYIKLLAPKTPIYNITSYGNRKKIITDFEVSVIDTLSRKHNLYMLARKENVFQKILALNERNYSIDSIIRIYPSFTTNDLPLYLLKVRHLEPNRGDGKSF